VKNIRNLFNIVLTKNDCHIFLFFFENEDYIRSVTNYLVYEDDHDIIGSRINSLARSLPIAGNMVSVIDDLIQNCASNADSITSEMIQVSETKKRFFKGRKTWMVDIPRIICGIYYLKILFFDKFLLKIKNFFPIFEYFFCGLTYVKFWLKTATINVTKLTIPQVFLPAIFLLRS